MKAIAILWFSFAAIAAAPKFGLANNKELQEDRRPVSPDHLTALIRNANRVVVRESPMQDAKKLFESWERKDLDALSAALVVDQPIGQLPCLCSDSGFPTIYLYKDYRLLAWISNQHGNSVSCSLWDSNARLLNPEKWLKWFDDRKIARPMTDAELQKFQEQDERNRKRWISAMPKGLEAIWKDSLGPFGEVNTVALAKALSESIPRNEDQILALLRWFGSGVGPWSQFPSYELAAEKLLLEYPIAEIVSAIENKNLSPEQIEGAARLLAGPGFSRKYPKGLEQVPDNLKRSLWDHVKNTGDEEKLRLATRAFNPKE